MMTQQESEALFRQHLTREQTHAHTELNRQAQNLQQGMLNAGQGNGESQGPMSPQGTQPQLTWQDPAHTQRRQQVALRAQSSAQTGVLTTQKLATLISTKEVPLHETGLQTVAQSMGLRYKSLEGLEPGSGAQTGEASAIRTRVWDP